MAEETAMNAQTQSAQYACDTCRSRKVACSRERSGCQRCKSEGTACSYSRSGVIRRNRKQRPNKAGLPTATPLGNSTTYVEPSGPRARPSQLSFESNDRSTTHERLQQFAGNDSQSLKALAGLLEEYTAAWQSSSAFDKLAEGAHPELFVFERDQVGVWVKAFVSVLEKEQMLLTSVPSDILEHLVESRPHQIRDRAWLVMFYGVALSTVNTSDESTMAKLRSNVWLAFNDARLLLEPNASSIQALVVLVCYGEKFMTPSLCWALVTKACVMLQALGINHWRFDVETRKRRSLLFWRLNVMDKAMALILNRPPTLHREMTSGIALPTLDQLLPYRASPGASTMFHAHYTYQMYLLSNVMADVWHCLYGQGSDDVYAVKENVDSWHRQAVEVLQAAAFTEKPLLTIGAAASVDHGLRTLRFHYLFLVVLLTASCLGLRTQCTEFAQELLCLLPNLSDVAEDLKEPYVYLIWQNLHYPLAAFGTLWGGLLTMGSTNVEQSKQSLEAIEHLPAFLRKLAARHSLASKLESITGRIVEHARSILHSQEGADPKSSDPNLSAFPQTPNSLQPVAGEYSDQQSTTNPSMALDNFDPGQLDSLFTWSDDGFFDTTFDWFAWGNQQLS